MCCSNPNKTPHSNPSPVVIFPSFIDFFLISSRTNNTHGPVIFTYSLSTCQLAVSFFSFRPRFSWTLSSLAHRDEPYKTRSSNHLYLLGLNALTKDVPNNIILFRTARRSKMEGFGFGFGFKSWVKQWVVWVMNNIIFFFKPCPATECLKKVCLIKHNLGLLQCLPPEVACLFLIYSLWSKLLVCRIQKKFCLLCTFTNYPK